MTRCAPFQPRRPRFDFIEKCLVQVHRSQQFVMPGSPFLALNRKVEGVHAPTQLNGPVHQSLMLLETLEGGGRVVMNAGMPRLGVEPFQLPCLQHRLCLGGGLPPTGVQRIDVIDEGLRGLQVTRQGQGERSVVWTNARDFFEAPPGHAVASTQTFHFLKIGFPIEQILRECSPVKR